MKPADSSTAGLEDFLATSRFVLSLVFLVLLATLIVLWIEIPRFTAVNESLSSEVNDVGHADPMTGVAARLGGYVFIAVWLIGFVIVGEAIVQHIIQVRRQKPDDILKWRFQLLAQVICPPLRLAAPNLERQGHIWLPWIGWQPPNRKLFRKLQSVFSKPMFFFALLILPVLLIEFGLHSQVERYPWLRLTLHICTGLIWCAFAVEFIVLFNVSERKFTFVKTNWIDLAIILLPVIMFLRSLRAFRLMRIAKLAKAQQLTNLSRVYRVRGVAMKAVRAFLLLEIFNRMIPVSAEKKLNRLQREYDYRKEDLDELGGEIEKLQSQIREQAAEKKTT